MMASQLIMPGPSAPAFEFRHKKTLRRPTTRRRRVSAGLSALGLIVGALSTSMPAHAQQSSANPPVQISQQPTIQVPPSIRPTPGQLELSKLLWSTVIAVHHANTSGNYSVLRDISASAFQIKFNPTRLAELFGGLRRLNVDLSDALLVPPTYYDAPQMVNPDTFRVRGIFQLRPIAVQFEAYYQWESGKWKLFGVEFKPQQMRVDQPVAK